MSVKSTYSLNIDFNNDGLLSPSENIFSDLVGITWKSGRDGFSNLTHIASAGVMNLTLKNYDGKYDEYNPSSILYDKFRRGLRVRLTAHYDNQVYVLATMYTKGISSNVYKNRQRVAQMECLGSLWWSDRDDLQFAILYSDYGLHDEEELLETDTIPSGKMLEIVLDKIGWPNELREIDVGRSQIRPYYAFKEGSLGTYQKQTKFLDAARIIERAENGYLHENRNGAIVFEDRDRRLKELGDNIIKAYLIDTPPTRENDIVISQIKNEDTTSDIYNYFYTDYNTFRTNNNFVVSDLANSIALKNRDLPQGTVISLDVKRTENDDWDYVKKWVEPYYELHNNSGNVLITLRNKGPVGVGVSIQVISGPVRFNKLEIRADVVKDNAGNGVIEFDQDSINRYGRIDYPFSGRLVRDVEELTNHAKWLLRIYKEKRPSITVLIDLNNSHRNMKNVLDLEISDILVVRSREANILRPHAFFLETVEHKIEKGLYHTAKLTLSSLERIQPFFVLDHSVLGDNSALHY